MDFLIMSSPQFMWTCLEAPGDVTCHISKRQNIFLIFKEMYLKNINSNKCV